LGAAGPAHFRIDHPAPGEPGSQGSETHAESPSI